MQAAAAANRTGKLSAFRAVFLTRKAAFFYSFPTSYESSANPIQMRVFSSTPSSYSISTSYPWCVEAFMSPLIGKGSIAGGRFVGNAMKSLLLKSLYFGLKINLAGYWP